MRTLYWLIQNQHEFKPRGANIWTFKASESYFFDRGGAYMHENTRPEKGETEAKKALAMAPTDP